jgi:hypothetical protein
MIFRMLVVNAHEIKKLKEWHTDDADQADLQ